MEELLGAVDTDPETAATPLKVPSRVVLELV